MNPAEMIVAIVAIVILGGVLRARFAHRQAAHAPIEERPEADDLRREVRQLRERIQVLERVITDNRSSIELDREIDRLRDR